VEKYGTARQATDENIVRRMRITCWISKATNTQSEYVLIICFPLQQLLHERTLQYYVYTTFPILLSYVSVSLGVAEISEVYVNESI